MISAPGPNYITYYSLINNINSPSNFRPIKLLVSHYLTLNDQIHFKLKMKKSQTSWTNIK